MIKNKFIKIIITFIIFVSLPGCFYEDGVSQKYFKEFKHIKTDQFVWMYGRGGIYWVSDNAVVLDALVTNSEGVPERGIYQVNIDGSYVRLVEPPKTGPYDYCFDGETLYLRDINDQFNVVNEPSGYKLAFDKKIEFMEGYTYSEIRCRQIKRPTDNGYYFLKEHDGAIKIPRNGFNEYGIPNPSPPNTTVNLVKSNGETLKSLSLTIEQLSSPRFYSDRKVYFGSIFTGNCGRFWWLSQDGFKLKMQKKCLGKWAASSSIIALSTRVGLFIEHHTRTNKYKTYLVTGDKEYALETVSARRAVLAPDGCRVAYGSGDYRARNRGPHDYRQVLKLFDSCQFMDDQGE